MDNASLSERSLFVVLSAIFVLLLSFRPIPSAESKNDTGRYVDVLKQYCDTPLQEFLANKGISYGIFFMVNTSACWAGTKNVFLLQVAALLPLSFLFFADWRNGTFLWAVAGLFSVYGIELMTNAMRQSLAMLLFFWAISLSQEHRIKAAVFVALLAALAHMSVIAYVPLFIWIIVGAKSVKKASVKVVVMTLSLILGVAVIFLMKTFNLINITYNLVETYQNIYAEHLKTTFLIYIILPIYFIYSVRFIMERHSISSEENKAIIYSSVLLILSLAFFPTITFRFAIFSLVLQLFLVIRSLRHSWAAGNIVFIGLAMHLFFILTTTHYIAELING